MQSHTRPYSWRRSALLFILLGLALGISLPAAAQDETDEPEIESEAALVEVTEEAPTEAPTESPTEVPTEAPTEIPTEVPTEVPTEAPTETPPEATTEVPTEVPTDATPSPPTDDTPTDETPTEVPATETPEATSDATEVVTSAPPVFNTDTSVVYEITAGQTLTVDLSVSDDEGEVTISADTAATVGSLTINVISPGETSAPYNTLVSVLYTAPADYMGGDTFLLTATDASGQSVAALLVVNVLPAPVETEVVEATPEATIEATPEDTVELIISLDTDASEAEIEEVIESLGAEEVEHIPQIGALVVEVPRSESRPSVAMETLEETGADDAAGVTSVERNGRYHVLSVPDEWDTPNENIQPNLRASNTFSINAEQAWDAATTHGLGVVVAVLDTGVDLDHPDLINRIDTVNMWDFVSDDNSPDDSDGHGTRMAGIIAAEGDNGIQIAGVAYEATIMPLRVCSDEATCSYSAVSGAIVHAVDNGADVIVMGFGNTLANTSEVVHAAIDYAVSNDVVVVAAAGNTGDTLLHYPAAFPGVIGVGSHSLADGSRSSFSVQNASIDFTAPGEDILTLDNGGGTVTAPDGTSFAAAHVAGVAALLIGQNVATTPASVEDALVCGAVDPLPTGRDDSFGWGRVNASASMNWTVNSLGCDATVPNDNLTNATTINSIPFTETLEVTNRTVTEHYSDPRICGEIREQTVWYRFTPSSAGYYQVDTYGSNYATVIGIYQGSGSSLSNLNCVEGQQVGASLVNGFTYYIGIGTNGAAVNNKSLRVSMVGSLIATNTNYQENSSAISYHGNWSRVTQTGASGGFIKQSTAAGAGFSFSFRGTSFTYYRTIGRNRGRMQVFVDGTLRTTISNNSTTTQVGQPIIINVGGSTGRWHTVHFRMDPSHPGRVDVDRIRTRDYDGSTNTRTIGTTKTDNSATNTFRFTGTWNAAQLTLSNGWRAMNNRVRQTSRSNAAVTFRVRGNAIRIWRGTGSNFARMSVSVDGGTPIIISNTASSNQIRPYTLVGYSNIEHVVRVRILDNKRFYFDAVQGLNLSRLPIDQTINDRDTRLAFNGVTSNQNNVAGASQLTTRRLNPNTEAVFTFASSDLCIGYRATSTSGAIRLEIDNQQVDMNGLSASGTFSPSLLQTAGTGFKEWCLRADGDRILANRLHVATLTALNAPVTLDYIRAQNYLTLTPARGIVNETDAAFLYGDPSAWEIISATGSDGGYPSQGAEYREATFGDDQQTITFYMNGTGFLIYSIYEQSAGCWAVWVDDVPNRAGTPDAILLMSDAPGADNNAPIALGVTDLTPGIHRVVLEVDIQCIYLDPSGQTIGGPVVLDAVRVIP